MNERTRPTSERVAPELDAVVAERRQLLNIAYRLLGSRVEAEDVVQETYVRWYAMSPERQVLVQSPGAWLTTVASRISLDVLGSARSRRERYVGEWIPEPLPEPSEWISGAGGPSMDPADRLTLDESVSMAFLVVLESMTPPQRVAFILHDVFRYHFSEIAEIVGRTPAACRQLASSARRRIGSSQLPAAPWEHAHAVADFKRAWETADLDALIHLLDPGAKLVADGGGVVPAVLLPMEGGELIAGRLVEFANTVPTLSLVERTVNGQPGLVALQDGGISAVMSIRVVDSRITDIWVVRNPEKLRWWRGPQVDHP
jgi:RNA polymerase sigma-70 factor (ECF subfamily)